MAVKDEVLMAWWDRFELLLFGKIGNTWERGQADAMERLLEDYPSARVAALEADVAALEQTIEHGRAINARLEAENTQLRQELEVLRAMIDARDWLREIREASRVAPTLPPGDQA